MKTSSFRLETADLKVLLMIVLPEAALMTPRTTRICPSLQLETADLTVLLPVRVLPEAALAIPWMTRICPPPTLGKVPLSIHRCHLPRVVMHRHRFVFLALALCLASCLERFYHHELRNMGDIASSSSFAQSETKHLQRIEEYI
jgi:hypothetical protein